MTEDKPKSSLSKEQVDIALKWLTDKWPETNHNCEICNTNQWMVLGDIITPMIAHPRGSVYIGGSTYPQFMVMCKNCGNTKYFNALISGVLKVEKEEKNGKSS